MSLLVASTPVIEMDATYIAAWAGAAMSCLSLVSVFYFAGIKMATLTVKVDTMWTFMMKRAVSEAVGNDLMKHNSPLEITAKGYNYIKPMANEMWQYYQKHAISASKLNDADLALAIERDFGERLLKEICIPNNLLFGECIILAIEAVRKDGEIETKLREDKFINRVSDAVVERIGEAADAAALTVPGSETEARK
jgi:hypothetical protein